MRLRQGCSGLWLALLAAAADRVTKALALARWEARNPFLSVTFDPLIPGVLNLTLARNTGVAFSGLAGGGAAVIALTALLIAGLLFYLLARPNAPRLSRAGLWLIVGGGLGNLYDRLRFGYVIDFIELAFVRFAVFNVADVCVCLGAALTFLGVMLSEGRERCGHGQ